MRTNELCLVLKYYLQNMFSLIRYNMYNEDLVLNNLKWLICHKKPNFIYAMYMYKEDLVLNNLQRLICPKTQPIKSYIFYVYV